ncbi:hypothetical protein RFI_15113 [Reticulomyxa filosa]|uniref:type I protein arginine methyltransferase n=1 Tax=Reticulomyxa filosa TaxID=46433 RepID=X6N9W2_RETFI|nr:hypothetical protein RFI_15113 [Reticulomyxa filosa]|eukprot:ETO22092.1 hypothetical protein RFI_15113 [Reticulomyxa filosa]
MSRDDEKTTKDVIASNLRNDDNDIEEYDFESESSRSEIDDAEELEPTQDLFSPKETFCNAQEVLDNVRKTWSFDVIGFVREHNLDTYGYIKLINYIRHRVNCKDSPQDIIRDLQLNNNETEKKESTDKCPLPFQDEKYLKPVLANDPLLYYDFDNFESDKDDNDDDNDDNDDDNDDDNNHETTNGNKNELCNDRTDLGQK